MIAQSVKALLKVGPIDLYDPSFSCSLCQGSTQSYSTQMRQVMVETLPGVVFGLSIDFNFCTRCEKLFVPKDLGKVIARKLGEVISRCSFAL